MACKFPVHSLCPAGSVQVATTWLAVAVGLLAGLVADVRPSGLQRDLTLVVRAPYAHAFRSRFRVPRPVARPQPPAVPRGWVRVPGGLTQVSVRSAGRAWGVNRGQQIWRYAGKWTSVPGGLKHVSVGVDGTVWGVNGSNVVYQFVGGRWRGRPGRLAQISVGSAQHVWGVAANQTIWRWAGRTWANVPGRLRYVSVGADGAVWGIDAGSQIFRREGNSWRNVPGGLRQISVGSAGRVWGVNAGGAVYRWNGRGWTSVPGSLWQVSVAADGTVWGVDKGQGIWRWPQRAPSVGGAPAPAAPSPVLIHAEKWNYGASYHYSTRSAAEARKSGWTRIGPAFRAFTTQAPGTIPVYVETPVAKPHSKYYYSTRSAALARHYGFKQLGVAFYAYPRPAKGTVPVYEETPRARPHSVYHFSPRGAAQAARHGWKINAVAFHAFPVAAVSRPVARPTPVPRPIPRPTPRPNPPPLRPVAHPATPIYIETPARAPGSNYYLTTRSEAEARKNGWRRNGVGFQAFTKQAPGTVPVYLEGPAANPHSKYHYSTRSAAAAHRYGFKQLGVAFYAYPRPVTGAVPIYEETPAARPHSLYHFHPRGAAGAARYGFRVNGIAFYAFPATGAAPPTPTAPTGSADPVAAGGEAVGGYSHFKVSWAGWRSLFRREGQVFRADVRIVDQPATLIVYFPPGKKKPNVAVLTTNLSIGKLITAAEGTVFDDIVVRDAVFIFAPKGNEEFNRVDTLPPAIREQVRKVRPGQFHFVEGHNLFATVEPRQSSSTANLLETVGLDLQNMKVIAKKGQTCIRKRTKKRRGRYSWRKKEKTQTISTCWRMKSVLLRRADDWKNPFHLDGVTLHDATVELHEVAKVKTIRGWGRSTVRGKQYFLFAQHTPKTKGLAFALDAKSISLWDYWNVFSTVARTVVGAAGLGEVQQVMRAIDGLPLDQVRVENPAYDTPGYSPLKNLDEDGRPIFDNALIVAASPTERLPDVQGTCGPIVIVNGRGKAFGAPAGTLEARIERDRTSGTRGQPCRPAGRLRYHAKGMVRLPKWGPVNLGDFQFQVDRTPRGYQMDFKGRASVGAGPFKFSDSVEIAVSGRKGKVSAFRFKLPQRCPHRPLGIEAEGRGMRIGAGSGFRLSLTGNPLACAADCFRNVAACAASGVGWAGGLAKKAYEGARAGAAAAVGAARRALRSAAATARRVAGHVSDAFAGTVRKVSESARKGIKKAKDCLKSAFTSC